MCEQSLPFTNARSEIPLERKPINSFAFGTRLEALQKEGQVMAGLEAELQERRMGWFQSVSLLLTNTTIKLETEPVGQDLRAKSGVLAIQLEESSRVDATDMNCGALASSISVGGTTGEELVRGKREIDTAVSDAFGNVMARIGFKSSGDLEEEEVTLNSCWQREEAEDDNKYVTGFNGSKETTPKNIDHIRDLGRTNLTLAGGASRTLSWDCSLTLDPSGPFRILWNILSLLLIIFDITIVPLKVFYLPVQITDNISSVESISSAFWILDVFVSLRTCYYDGTTLETRPLKIAIRYVKTWFAIDLLLISTDVASIFARVLFGNSILRLSRSMRIFRSLRILRFAKAQELILRLELLVGDKGDTFLLTMTAVKMMVSLLLVIHMCSCAWYAIGVTTENSWIEDLERKRSAHNSPPSGSSVLFWYSASSRWMLAQLNGKTDTDVERNQFEMMYTCIIAVLFPVLVMSVFISTITKAAVDMTTLNRKGLMVYRNVNFYLSSHNVRLSVAHKVHKSVAVMLARSDHQRKWVIEDEVMGCLTAQVQRLLLWEVRGPIVEASPFFTQMQQRFPVDFRAVLEDTISVQMSERGDEIFNTGDICEGMLFIVAGRMQYGHFETVCEKVTQTSTYADDPSTLGETLWQGIWLCEPALWVRKWRNKGHLISGARTVRFTVDRNRFIGTAQRTHASFTYARSYGRRFVEELSQLGQLSDLLEVLVG